MWLAFKIPGLKGLYKVGIIGIKKLILDFRYKVGFKGNNAIYKLGASIATSVALIKL